MYSLWASISWMHLVRSSQKPRVRKILKVKLTDIWTMTAMRHCCIPWREIHCMVSRHYATHSHQHLLLIRVHSIWPFSHVFFWPQNLKNGSLWLQSHAIPFIASTIILMFTCRCASTLMSAQKFQMEDATSSETAPTHSWVDRLSHLAF